jgi:hypothetical protein
LLFAPPVEAFFEGFDRHRVKAWSATASWAVGLKDVDIRVGADLAGLKEKVDTVLALRVNGTDIVSDETHERSNRTFDRAYIDVRAEPTDTIILQGRVARSEAAEGHHLDWQAGIAIEPAEGQWFRGAYVRETSFPTPFTLAPARVAGLAPSAAPVPAGGRIESGIIRWDAEWTPHFFTAIEYQHQDYQAVSFDRPDLLMPLCLEADCVIGPADYVFGAGRSARLSVTANLWLTGNWGVNATYARSASALKTPLGDRGAIPFLPRDYGRLGVSWTSPKRIKLSASASYVGSRRSEVLTTRLGDYVSIDATAEWQSPDKRFEVDIGITNAFNAGYRVTTGLPGWGRALTASLTARF